VTKKLDSLKKLCNNPCMPVCITARRFYCEKECILFSYGIFKYFSLGNSLSECCRQQGIQLPKFRGGQAPQGERLTYTVVDGSNNPFPRMTGGSSCFRIPALVTLADGSLCAAADARWNTTYDGGGLDTMIARSKNNGKNWEWAFVNYLDDNGNAYNGKDSTCFIDPALAVDGTTVYLLADLFPYGVALNGNKDTAPEAVTGFTAEGKLRLDKNNQNTYAYYLDGNKIKSIAGDAVQDGYTVDAFFNITKTADGAISNLFFKDSDFKVQRTSYLYVRKSQDGGTTWGDPMLIPLKKASEKAYLVGPGRGIVTKKGRIVFPCYSHNGSNDEKMNFIYSDDGGTSWMRSADSEPDAAAAWSSESAVVELRDGTLRFFFRNNTKHLCYRDYKDGWLSVIKTGNKTNSNTQLSAITYSKQKDGKQVVLVSCPTGPNRQGSDSSNGETARLNGEIFIGTVNADNTMDWDAIQNIRVTENEAQFMYSCLTELPDGRIAILYEDSQHSWGTGDDKYFTLKFKICDLSF